MKKWITLFSLMIFVCSCGHTNQLANYVLRGKKAFYSVSVAPKARTIEVNIEKSKSKEKEKSDLEKVLEAGSEILSSGKIAEIKDHIDTEQLISFVSQSLEDALTTFLDINAVNRKLDQPDFLVEVRLNNCALNVRENGSSVSMFATAKIIERKSGGIVWENWETYTIPIGQKKYSREKSNSSTETKVLTAAQLLALSTKDLDYYVGQAAEIIGVKMADTFREDYNEAIKDKTYDKD